MSEGSFLISKLVFLAAFIEKQYENSWIKKQIQGFSLWFMGVWKHSLLHSFLMDGILLEKGFKQSVFQKINDSQVFEKTTSIWKKALPEESFIGFLSDFCEDLLYIPLSSIGLLFFSLGISTGIAYFIQGGAVSLFSIISMGLGAVLFQFRKVTMISIANGSLLVSQALIFFRLETGAFKEKNAIHHYKPFLASMGVVCGLTSLWVAPIYSILLLFAIAGTVLVFYKTEIGIYALVFLLPLLPTKISLGLSVLIALSFLAKLFTNQIQLRLDGMDVLVLLYGLVLLYSLGMSFIPRESLPVTMVYLLFLLVYMAVKHCIISKKQVYLLIGLFITSSILLSLYGIFQKLTGSFIVTESWIDSNVFGGMNARIYSTLDNPNVLGEYLIFSIIISFTLLYANKKISYKLFGLLSLAISGLCMIFTLSRGAWLGLIFAMAIFALVHDRRLIVLGLFCLPLLPFILPSSIIERFTSIGDMSDGSTSYRVGIWLASIELIKSFWPVGIGLSERVFLFIYQKFAFNAVFASHSHNLYMQWLIDYGIVGFIVLVSIIILFAKKALQAYQNSKDTYLKSIMAGLLAGMIGYLVQGMTDNVWYNYRIVLFFWVICGLMNAITNLKECNYE